jgi:uncharacterized protein YcbX
VSESLACTIASLHLHPIKSCAGIAVPEALLIETGLELDRAWMVVDARGEMITQRERPRLALVRPTLRINDLVLRAPGMLALHLALDTVEAPARARVWDDEVAAFDMGALAAQWFSDFIGEPARLVRFDPDQQRLCDRAWTGEVAAETAFADGFPLLVVSSASLAELNQRLAERGAAAVGMDRFRPNIVLDGLQAHDEDRIDEIRFEAEGGPVRIRLVKPCTRCSIPDLDPVTAELGHAVGDTLAGYRADARVQGGVTFGMNAIVVEGVDRVLRPGQRGAARWDF